MAEIAVFDVSRVMPANWTHEVAMAAVNYGKRVVRDHPVDGSLEEGGLDYRVVDGKGCRAALPWIFAASETIGRIAGEQLGVTLEPRADIDARFNINLLEPGKGYERHVDQNSYTVVVFPETMQSGALVTDRARILPSAGLAVGFNAGSIPHGVEPPDFHRLTLIFAYTLPGERVKDINGALYGGD